MKKKKKEPSYLDVAKSIRKGWGQTSPVTRVVKSKKVYSRKQKHKKNQEE